MVFDSIALFVVCYLVLFFFNDTATTEIYTLSLHDALPISLPAILTHGGALVLQESFEPGEALALRSEEHTSELQSPCNLVCRLLLEKKKKRIYMTALRFAAEPSSSRRQPTYTDSVHTPRHD